MQTTMTLTEKRELITLHSRCEVAQDWAGARATLADDPYYEYYPMGVRINGADAITEFWKIVFTKPFMSQQNLARGHEQLWVHNDYAITQLDWPIADLDGVERTTTAWGICWFEGDRVKHETVFADSVFAAVMAPFLDGSFLRIPGVERIAK